MFWAFWKRYFWSNRTVKLLMNRPKLLMRQPPLAAFKDKTAKFPLPSLTQFRPDRFRPAADYSRRRTGAS